MKKYWFETVALDDPDVAMSATKIQASFRGKQARTEVAKIKEDKISEEIKDNLANEPENHKELTYSTVEEEIDIDMNDPEVTKSATKIQAGFRGKKARNEVAKMKESNEEIVDNFENEPINSQEESKFSTVEEEIDIDMNDPDVAKSATKIQAGFRGKKARCEVAKMKENNECADENIESTKKDDSKAIGSDLNNSKQSEISSVETDTIDQNKNDMNNGDKKKKMNRSINWDDPDLDGIATNIQAGYRGMKIREEMKTKEEDDAAKKIQANFKGFKARKRVKKMRADKKVSETLGINLEDPEVQAAATKIQAGFRGAKTRNALKTANNPEITVEDPSEYTEYESETSYYEDEGEGDESESLEDRDQISCPINKAVLKTNSINAHK